MLVSRLSDLTIRELIRESGRLVIRKGLAVMDGMLEDIKDKLVNADPFKSWWPFIIAGAVFLVSTIKSYMAGQQCPNGNLIKDLVVVITGADGGIGREIVRELSKRGGIVIMCCKNPDNGEAVKQKIMKSLKKVRIDIRSLDLRSFDSVRQLVKSIGKH